MKQHWGKGKRVKGKTDQLPLLSPPYPFPLLPSSPFLLCLNRQAAISDDTHDVGIGNELAFDLGLTAHPLHARSDTQGGHFQRQRVARHDGFSKTSLPDAGKQDQLRVAILNFPQGQHCSHLRQSFDDKHAGHDGCARKVALKKGLIDADLFNADDSFPRNQLYNSIHEQKGKTVRQEFLYGLGVENGFHDGNKETRDAESTTASPRLYMKSLQLEVTLAASSQLRLPDSCC